MSPYIIKRGTYCLLVCISFIIHASLFSQSWLWARQPLYVTNPPYSPTESDGEAYSVAADDSGNVYETGYFSYITMNYGVDTLTTVNDNMFLVKYNSAGVVQWAVQPGMTGNANGGCAGYYVATDRAGNVYVTGLFSDTIFFGTYLLTQVAGHGTEAFLAKYDAGGNVKWAVQSRRNNFNSNNATLGEGVATDAAGNVYMTGQFQTSTSFGPFTLTCPVGGDRYGWTGTVFVVKYDSSGNALWAKQGTVPSGYSVGEATAITTDAFNNAFITGTFCDTISFSSQTLVSASSACDIFTAKYDQNGNLLWARQSNNDGAPFWYWGGVKPFSGDALVTDKYGSVYVTGNFEDTTYFGATQLLNPVDYSQYTSFPLGDNVFLTKYDGNGNLRWAKAGYSLVDAVYSGWAVAADTLDHIYFDAGGINYYTSGSNGYAKLTFSMKWGNDTFTTAGLASVEASFLLQLDTGGNITCGTVLPFGADDEAGIAVTPSGSQVYFGGDVLLEYNSVPVGPDILSSEGMQLNSGIEIPFVLSWQPCPTCSATSSLTALKDSVCQGDTIELNESGTPGIIQWQLAESGNNFSNIAGADSSAFSETIQQTTAYRVVKTSGNCTDTSSPLTIVALPLSTPPQTTVSDSLICSGDSSRICALGNYTSYYWSTGDTTSCIEVKNAGGYWVTVTRAGGCPAISNHSSIAVYPVPSVSIVVQGDTLTSFGAVSYQWYYNNAPITGANQPIYIAAQTGNYAVEITDTNGCTETSSNTYVLTGVTDLKAGGAMNVYPNPFTNTIFITTNNTAEAIEDVSVYDELGQKVLGEKPLNNRQRISIDAPALPAGIFLVEINTDKFNYSIKMIKQ